MNITELIKKLEKVKENHGDINVRWGDYSEGMASELVLFVEMGENKYKTLFFQEYSPKEEL